MSAELAVQLERYRHAVLEQARAADELDRLRDESRRADQSVSDAGWRLREAQGRCNEARKLLDAELRLPPTATVTTTTQVLV